MKKLFWVTDNTNSENWFVISNSALKASTFYRNNEGMNKSNGVRATEVLTLTEDFNKDETYYAQIYMLRKLGFTILSETSAIRSVVYNGVLYEQGDLDEQIGDKIKNQG